MCIKSCSAALTGAVEKDGTVESVYVVLSPKRSIGEHMQASIIDFPCHDIRKSCAFYRSPFLSIAGTIVHGRVG